MGHYPSAQGMLTFSKFKESSVVLITGGSSGLGREIAFRYAERGCKIVISARGME